MLGRMADMGGLVCHIAAMTHPPIPNPPANQPRLVRIGAHDHELVQPGLDEHSDGLSLGDS